MKAAAMKETGRSPSLFEAVWRPCPGKPPVAEERRRHLRNASLIPVTFFGDGQDRKTFILNISSGGVFIGGAGYHPRDCEVLMNFEHPGTQRPISLVGRIAWASSTGVGVRFKQQVQSSRGPCMGPEGGGRKLEERKEGVTSMGKIKKKRVCWEPSLSADVATYRIYWAEEGQVGYSSRYVDVGKVTEVILPDDIASFPPAKGEVSLGVSALDESGNESDLAKMTAKFNFLVPDAPTNLVVEEV